MTALVPSVVDSLEKAVRLESLGELEKARASYRAVVDQHPEVPEALSLLGQLECRLGDHNAAVFHLRRAVRLAPARPDIHLGLGNALNSAGENRAAVKSYLAALQVDPSFAPGYVSLGRVLYRNGQAEKALQALERARQLDPSYPLAHYELGVFFQAQGRIEPAIAALLNCIRLDSTCRNAHLRIAELFILQAEFNKAVEHINSHLKLHSGDADAWATLAVAYLESDSLDAAEESAQQALQLCPAHSMALTQLGRIHIAKADLVGARRSFTAALAADSSNALAHASLAEACMQLGLHELAGSHMSAAGDPRRHDLATVLAYCRVLQAQNRAQQAIDILVERLDRRCDAAAGRRRCHFLLGDVFAMLGDQARAFRHYHNANDLRFQSFDVNGFDRQIRQIERFFTPTKIVRLSQAKKIGQQPVVIAGLPGAALGMIRAFLEQHPDVQSSNGSLPLHDIATNLPAYLGSALEYPDALTAARTSELEAIAADYCQQNFAAGQAPVLLDWHTENWKYLGLGGRLFPKMLVVHVVASPLFAAMDMYTNDQRGSATAYASNLCDIGRQTREFARIMTHWRQLDEFSILEVRLDSLLRNPQALSQRLSAFAGLRWRQEMAEFFDQSCGACGAGTRLHYLRNLHSRYQEFAPYAQEFQLAYEGR